VIPLDTLNDIIQRYIKTRPSHVFINADNLSSSLWMRL